MPHWKLSANASFFGATGNRFTQYQPERTLEEKLGLIGGVKGIDAVELKYPADFGDVQLVEELLERHGLELCAVNVGTKDAEHFRHGALSARSKAARREAVRRLCEGMDLAAELGAGMITTCPLADGYDYPFQTDYTAAWERFIDTVHEVAEHRPEVRFCLEFQPHEPHAHVLLDNVGKMLHVCAEAGVDNVGANLDIGHAIAAGEAPAESAALLAAKGRLFYIHSNDNTGDGGDWDMISGSVHFWHWLELLYTLDRIGYRGYIGADILAKHFGPTAAFDANVRMLRAMGEMVERMEPERIAGFVAQDGSSAELFTYLGECLLGDRD